MISEEEIVKLRTELAYIASASQQALVILAKCLMNNGALRPGQFSAALKDTFNHPETRWDRPVSPTFGE